MANDFELETSRAFGTAASEATEYAFDPYIPGKFTPPRIDPAFHIFRQLAIRPLLDSCNSHHTVLSIHARAGQGKSILTSQFLQKVRAGHSWLQIGEEDRDPVAFIAALFTALLKSIPGLNQSSIHQTITKGEVIGPQAVELVPMLVNDLKPFLNGNFYAVIDDMHLLKGADESLAFLNALIAQAPPDMRFILLSREPIALAACTGRQLILDNRSLAWNYNDVAMLFNQVFKRPLSANTVADLQKRTEGWVMGLILAGHALSQSAHKAPPDRSRRPMITHPDHFQNYFQNEILDRLDRDQQRAVLSLALLDHIPLDLAIHLNLLENMTEFLEQLVQQNFFLRRLEDTPPSYMFHHLFQECLRDLACRELSSKSQYEVLTETGHFFLRENRHELAMRYFMRANAYGMVENILRDVGLHMAGTNRTTTIREIVEKIPKEIIRAHAWLSFFFAYGQAETDPTRCKAYLDQALGLFITQHDEMGELAALTGLIAYHITVDCHLAQGRELLPRAEALYVKLEQKLLSASYFPPAYCIAAGLCNFAGQTCRAAEYTDKVFAIARERGLDDAMALSMAAYGFIYLFEGRWDALTEKIEQTLYLLQSPRVSNLFKPGIMLTQFVFLSLSGDTTTYGYYRELLNHLIEPALLADTMFGASLLVSDVSSAMTEGHQEEALQRVRQGFASSGSGSSAHMQSQHLAYYAYLLALDGRADEATTAAREAVKLRRETGGTYYEVTTNILIGGAYTLIHQYDKAESLLNECILIAGDLNLVHLKVGALAQRGFLHLNTGRLNEALEDIDACLKIMKRDRRISLYSWTPRIMKTVLATAVAHGIETEYAQKLAQTRLKLTILPQGEIIPLLEITSLGELQMKLDGVVRISSSDLTASQRELFALLVASPQNSVSHQTIQNLFWPENSAEKGRAKLDNLLSRLRKVLDSCLSPRPATDYLVVTRGLVNLQNCAIDCDRFLYDFRKGLRHLNKNEFWQAGNAFLRAHMLYNGEFMAGIHLKSPDLFIGETLRRAYQECTLHLARMLSGVKNDMEAIRICRRALQYDPIQEPLVKILYDLFVRTNNSIHAKKVVADYQTALIQQGFSMEEIEDTMDNFWRR